MPAVRLTSLSHGAGCACKLPPAELHALLGRPAPPGDPRLLVGVETADDAAVYRLRDDLALVSTADFFTPIVDDPYDFGRIAATNALSDVYAMGGTPVDGAQPRGLLARGAGGRAAARDPARRRRRGGRRRGRDRGGHSIDDPEPKYGLAVTGTVHPDRLVRNSTARAGDELCAHQARGRRRRLHGGQARHARRPSWWRAAVEVMTTLNGDASRAALAAGASAMTDVTGLRPARPPARAGLGERRGRRGRGRRRCPRSTACSSCSRGPSRRWPAARRRNRAWVEEVVDWAAACRRSGAGCCATR